MNMYEMNRCLLLKFANNVNVERGNNCDYTRTASMYVVVAVVCLHS